MFKIPLGIAVGVVEFHDVAAAGNAREGDDDAIRPKRSNAFVFIMIKI
jgi:hypothetical protein